MPVTLPPKTKTNTTMAENISKEALLMRAKQLDRYCELLIEQCDNWAASLQHEEQRKEANWKQKILGWMRRKPSNDKK